MFLSSLPWPQFPLSDCQNSSRSCWFLNPEYSKVSTRKKISCCLLLLNIKGLKLSIISLWEKWFLGLPSSFLGRILFCCVSLPVLSLISFLQSVATWTSLISDLVTSLVAASSRLSDLTSLTRGTQRAGLAAWECPFLGCVKAIPQSTAQACSSVSGVAVPAKRCSHWCFDCLCSYSAPD